MAKKQSYDAFEIWGELAAKFCIAFEFLVLNLLFMHVVFNCF